MRELVQFGHRAPGRRRLIWLSAIILVIGAGFVVAAARPSRQVPPGRNSGSETSRETSSGVVEQDADGDGLKNWEEVLYRTDPERADSDGDGTGDAEEILAGRDALKPGPDDRFPYPLSLEPTTNDQGPPSPQNLTAQLGARIAADFAAGEVSGRRPSFDALIERYAGALADTAVLEDSPRFSAASLTPADANDLTSVVKFFSAVEETWKKNFAPGALTDLETFFAAFENGGPGTIKSELEPYRIGYRAAIETIRSTPTPRDLQGFAVTLLNSLSRVERSVALMQEFVTDPLTAMLAIRERLALNERLGAFMAEAIQNAPALIQKKFAEAEAARRR